MTSRDPLTAAASQRLEWVDWLRGAAIVLVIFCHAVLALKVVDVATPEWASVANTLAGPYRMPLLMFLSGMLLSKSLRRPPREYMAGKLRRIGWPYVVWTTVDIAFLVGASQVFGNGNTGLVDVPTILFDPTTYTWYLAYLLLFYAISLVIPWRARAAAVPLLLAVAFLVADNDGWSRLTFLLAFFFLGDMASRWPAVWAWATNRWLPVAAATIAVGITAILTVNGVVGRFGPGTLIGVLGLLVVGRVIATQAVRVMAFRGLVAVGRDSIVYYTVHWVVIAATAHVLAKVDIPNGNLALLVLLCTGFIVPWFVVRLTRRSRFVDAFFVFPTRQSARSLAMR